MTSRGPGALHCHFSTTPIAGNRPVGLHCLVSIGTAGLELVEWNVARSNSGMNAEPPPSAAVAFNYSSVDRSADSSVDCSANSRTNINQLVISCKAFVRRQKTESYDSATHNQKKYFKLRLS